MFWIILFGVVLVNSVIWVARDSWDTESTFLMSVLCLLVLGILFLPVVQYFWLSYVEIDEFTTMKNYIENHEQTDKYEYVALMETKVEQNEWLFAKQANKRRMPFFSLFPDEILELEPIQ